VGRGDSPCAATPLAKITSAAAAATTNVASAASVTYKSRCVRSNDERIVSTLVTSGATAVST
jgi:hypothetical protein